MTNTELLNKKIEDSGLKIGFIAKKLNISRQYFWKKVNNQAYFNQYEIETLCDLLRISTLKEKKAIFFASNVD